METPVRPGRVEADPQAPLVLAVDASGPVEALTLVQGEVLLASALLRRTRRKGGSLPAQVAQLLDAGDRKPSDLSCIAAARGPGAFTGLRVGLATVQGMARALAIPLFAFSSTRGWADSATPSGLSTVAVALDARRGEVYARLYRSSPSGLKEAEGPVLLGAAEWVDGLGALVAEGAALVGDGAWLYREKVEAAHPGVFCWPKSAGGPALAGVAAEVSLRFARGERPRPEELSPIYLREHDGARARSS